MKQTIAMGMTKFFRFFNDLFFRKRYGHGTVVLETVAGNQAWSQGCVDTLQKSKTNENGVLSMIRELLEEAENERMHLMFFIEIAKPNLFERLLVLLAQGIFWLYYFTLYVISPSAAH